MTIQPFRGAEPRKPEAHRVLPDSGKELVSLDELLSLAATAEPIDRADGVWLRWVRQIVSEGWGPTLRAAFLITVPATAVLAVAGLFPAVCTTIALIVGREAIRIGRVPRIA
ncbi:hypothetical protein [Actinokineospora sp.]|uniref:hypothetical protein n=1 Tax=Actinokineospora sp. TaxID=1872133 RepID=UPI003D6AF53E